ncbi:MAG: hypothetical protein HONDAALG_00308 [Gammaproteobacteria bacterium]|nr:hypothetical protein [Gammaproteobacteria bacterium]
MDQRGLVELPLSKQLADRGIGANAHGFGAERAEHVMLLALVQACFGIAVAAAPEPALSRRRACQRPAAVSVPLVLVHGDDVGAVRVDDAIAGVVMELEMVRAGAPFHGHPLGPAVAVAAPLRNREAEPGAGLAGEGGEDRFARQQAGCSMQLDVTLRRGSQQRSRHVLYQPVAVQTPLVLQESEAREQGAESDEPPDPRLGARHTLCEIGQHVCGTRAAEVARLRLREGFSRKAP